MLERHLRGNGVSGICRDVIPLEKGRELHRERQSVGWVLDASTEPFVCARVTHHHVSASQMQAMRDHLREQPAINC